MDNQINPKRVDSIYYPPRGLSRIDSARYIGVSPSKFDQMIAENVMPRPKRIGGRVIWDRIELDIAFTSIPNENDDTEFLSRLFDKRSVA